MPPSPRPIEQVQAAHEAAWLALPQVIGTGIAECDGHPCLNVFVSAPDAAHGRIPDHVRGNGAHGRGYAVRIGVVGDVRALDP